MTLNNFFKPVLMGISIMGISLGLAAGAEKKPLKVFIIAGQSNAQGHALVTTFEGMKMEPVNKVLTDAMMNEDGSPVVLDDVYISGLSGSGGWGPDKPLVPMLKEGKLTVNYGAWGRYGIPKEPKSFKIGPEYSFGIFMHKHLNEPFLIIKTAWGGRSLHTNFRPPSAGPYKWRPQIKEMLVSQKRFEEIDKKKQAEVGFYYREMLAHVKKVLEDPAKVHPAYDPAAGYELAGFVWFQGFNDRVDSWTYGGANDDPHKYDLYAKLLGHFIRDVRKDLKAPAMPFLIGVMGLGGDHKDQSDPFREAMARPATLPEFKGNVIAVETAKCWDPKLGELDQKYSAISNDFKNKARAFKKSKPKPAREAVVAFETEQRAKQEQLVLESLGADGLAYYRANRSNGGYHYLGSAKIMGGIGKAFADALFEHPANKKVEAQK